MLAFTTCKSGTTAPPKRKSANEFHSTQTREVLMMAWMNEEAVRRTISQGTTWFWSRSRQKFWHKGEESGNTQKLVELRYDCDADTLLALVNPAGPACHTGARSCFFNLIQEDGR